MQRRDEAPVEVAIGYAAGPGGMGLAYAGLSDAHGREVMRLPFRIARLSLLVERAVAYAALVTVARALLRRGIRRARFVLPETGFVEEVTTRRDLPETLALPYVRLRCALNALDDYEIRSGATDELMQRARAEVALNLAA
ncbi:MAG: hypothetical protein WAK16_12110 [Candidatus Cybelea sp.]|jgi:hypothetical protein